MNKLIMCAICGIILFWLTYVPVMLGNYGIVNVNPSTPFYEWYSVIVTGWLFAHAFIAIFIWCSRGLLWGRK